MSHVRWTLFKSRIGSCFSQTSMYKTFQPTELTVHLFWFFSGVKLIKIYFCVTYFVLLLWIMF